MDDQRAKRDEAMRDLLAPHWVEVETESGCRISNTLRTLYEDSRLVTQLDLLVQDPRAVAPIGEWSLHEFQVANAEALRPHGPNGALAVSFCFAASYRTHLYGVLLSEGGEDGPVFRYSFDGESVRLHHHSLRSCHGRGGDAR